MERSAAVEEPLTRSKRQFIRPRRTELVTIVGSETAALGPQVISILRLGPLILFRLTDRVLVSVTIQHAPVRGESLFKSYLQRVRDRTQIVRSEEHTSEL